MPLDMLYFRKYIYLPAFHPRHAVCVQATYRNINVCAHVCVCVCVCVSGKRGVILCALTLCTTTHSKRSHDLPKQGDMGNGKIQATMNLKQQFDRDSTPIVSLENVPAQPQKSEGSMGCVQFLVIHIDTKQHSFGAASAMLAVPHALHLLFPRARFILHTHTRTPAHPNARPPTQTAQ